MQTLHFTQHQKLTSKKAFLSLITVILATTLLLRLQTFCHYYFSEIHFFSQYCYILSFRLDKVLPSAGSLVTLPLYGNTSPATPCTTFMVTLSTTHN